MKRALMRIAGRTAFLVLNQVDRFTNGFYSGLSEAERHENPYRGYEINRARGNVVRSHTDRGWVVLGFDETRAAFRDPRLSSDLRKNRFIASLLRAAADGGPVALLDDPNMLGLDPPDHTRLRKLANHAFTNRLVQSLAPHIAEIVDECLDKVADDHFDVVEILAKPLPAIVIAELLGLPAEDRERFQFLSDELLKLTHIDKPEDMEEGSRANAELMEYFRELAAIKREKPGQDLISQLIAAEEEGDRLSEEEMYSMCVLLLIAGHETTTRLIGNGLYLLLTHPDQMALLREDASLIPNAVEEMLRFEPPIQVMPRFATEDMEFGGKQIRKDQLVLPMIGAANRDPAANDSPNEFNVRRENIQHVAFGYGIHLCLGLALARLEARIAFEKLLERYPHMTLPEQDFGWTGIGIVRGLEQLVVDVR